MGGKNLDFSGGVLICGSEKLFSLIYKSPVP